HAGFAVRRLDQPVGRAAEKMADHLAVQLVVLDVEDGLRAHAVVPPSRRSGIATKKVEPRPGSLSTHTLPLCSSTNLRVMLSPSPVPPTSLVMVASACRNSSKSASILSLAIPIPVSATR